MRDRFGPDQKGSEDNKKPSSLCGRGRFCVVGLRVRFIESAKFSRLASSLEGDLNSAERFSNLLSFLSA